MIETVENQVDNPHSFSLVGITIKNESFYYLSSFNFLAFSLLAIVTTHLVFKYRVKFKKILYEISSRLWTSQSIVVFLNPAATFLIGQVVNWIFTKVKIQESEHKISSAHYGNLETWTAPEQLHTLQLQWPIELS